MEAGLDGQRTDGGRVLRIVANVVAALMALVLTLPGLGCCCERGPSAASVSVR
ncbi:MAG: hypothetical protein IPM29_04415 [Planctomycetes bacterium]|nr:hypothetical protein [Planctomycetota bacterium]